MILRSGPCPDRMPGCFDAVKRLAADGAGSFAGLGNSDRGLRTVAPLSTSRSAAKVAPVTRIPPLWVVIAAWPRHRLLTQSIYTRPRASMSSRNCSWTSSLTVVRVSAIASR
ncbi:hypothetical protein NKCBBBOE_03785 [Pseudarthrobacter sp. MM222]|nr:hypothetical protein NKCBBBOE_03785 [Pseudarthrobacter sp. MM222]